MHEIQSRESIPCVQLVQLELAYVMLTIFRERIAVIKNLGILFDGNLSAFILKIIILC